MPPALALAAIVTLAAMLACASAIAGMLWWRLRTLRAAGGVRAEAPGPVAEPPVPAVVAPAASPWVSAGPKGPRRPDRAAEARGAGPTLIEVPDLGITEGEADPGAELGRRYGGIWELADAGATAEAIARATGQPVGQVELILNLRRQSAAAGTRP